MLLPTRVRNSKQHIGMAWLVESAPTGEILAPKAMTDVALVEIFAEVLLV